MIVKSKKEIEILKEGGQMLARILASAAKKVRPGVLTSALNEFAENEIKKNKTTPSFKGYRTPESPNPYPAALCVSVNDEIVHGLPGSREIKEGDVVSLDLGIEYKGFFTDAAITVIAGKGSAQDEKLVEVCRGALYAGIKECRAGAALGDVGRAIQSFAESRGFGVIRELVGHGVGRSVHEEPQIPNWGIPGKGARLKKGAVIALEPMITAGQADVYLAPDGWTWKTKDGSKTAHFEHTIAVFDDKAEILTEFG